MIIFIDNFDSFTYNLVQAFKILGQDVVVFRNDRCTPQQCLELRPTHVVIGPGPGSPADSGISIPLISLASKIVPVLGVCLGHQCIGQMFGGAVCRAIKPMHGKISEIIHNGKGIFQGMPQPFRATRYHSLVIEKHTFPQCLETLATTSEEEIMAIKHSELPIAGVQFHPEAVETQEGLTLLKNFLNGERL